MVKCANICKKANIIDGGRRSFMKLNRKERVNQTLTQFTKEDYLLHKDSLKGCDAQDIADYLKISRANASKELNELVREGRAIKLKGKPVHFLSTEIIEKKFKVEVNIHVVEHIEDLFKKQKEDATQTNLFNIIGKDGSLRNAIEVAKSAIIYPPMGLNTLITGETGVGKSLFAEEMYRFGVMSQVFTEGAPFVTFNCADYAENQQLLLSQLFGYVKGAFTGATEEKKGLVEQAENGVLFLDEIHRLSEEGQEMFFLLMDKGIYRKLGESTFERKANIMIIGATTENPKKVMLSTFLRRIPIIIQLPSFNERTIRERFDLVKHIFENESIRLKKEIKVSKEVIRALVQYKCIGNIGQLKSDIQVLCAKAFLEAMTVNREKIEVKTIHLPQSIHEALIFHEKKAFFELNKLLSSRTLSFPSQVEDRLTKCEMDLGIDEGIYEWMKKSWEEMTSEGIPVEEKIKSINEEIEVHTHSLSKAQTIHNQLINKQIEQVVKKVLMKYRFWSEKNEFSGYVSIITLHLQHLISRLEMNGKLEGANEHVHEVKDDTAFTIAKELFVEISNIHDIDFSYVDIIYMARFLHLTRSTKDRTHVAILVIMHGDSTAKSMANFVNQLLNVDFARAIDMELGHAVNDVLKVATEMVREIDQGKGVLILADMGSILGFDKYIYDAIGVSVKTIDMISTPLLLEATRKAFNYETDLKQLYDYVDNLKREYYVNDMRILSLRKERGHSYFDKMIISSIEKSMVFLNVTKAYNLLKPIFMKVLNKYNLTYSDDVYVKYIFHAVGMVERSITSEIIPYENYQSYLATYPNLTRYLQDKISEINEAFAVKISEQELAALIDIFVYKFPKANF